MTINKMIRIALLAGLGFLLMFTLEFPLPFLPPYLKYDPSEIPALIAAFAWGPWVGVLVELIKNILFFISGKATSGIIGFLAAFMAGGSYVLVAGSIYEHRRTRTGALFALVTASLVMTLIMALANFYILLPLWGISNNEVMPLIIGAVIPFNLFKAFLSGGTTFVIYKRIRVLLGEKAHEKLVADKGR